MIEQCRYPAAEEGAKEEEKIQRYKDTNLGPDYPKYQVHFRVPTQPGSDMITIDLKTSVDAGTDARPQV